MDVVGWWSSVLQLGEQFGDLGFDLEILVKYAEVKGRNPLPDLGEAYQHNYPSVRTSAIIK